MEEKDPQKTTETSSTAANAPKEKKNFLEWLAAELFDYAEMFVFAAMAVLLIFTFGLRLCTVRGPSMLQTLVDGEQLLISDIGYKPARGDILVFHQTSDIYLEFNEPIVKRVIATEGEWIDINRTTQTVTIYDENMENPMILDESSYRYLDSGEWGRILAMPFPAQVPEGHIFVMGDNRNNSSDSSTSSVIGFVDTRRVLGRVIWRLTPFQKFGPIED